MLLRHPRRMTHSRPRLSDDLGRPSLLAGHRCRGAGHDSGAGTALPQRLQHRCAVESRPRASVPQEPASRARRLPAWRRATDHRQLARVPAWPPICVGSQLQCLWHLYGAVIRGVGRRTTGTGQAGAKHRGRWRSAVHSASESRPPARHCPARRQTSMEQQVRRESGEQGVAVASPKPARSTAGIPGRRVFKDRIGAAQA